MKRLILLVTLCLLLVGCSGTESRSPGEVASTESAEPAAETVSLVNKEQVGVAGKSRGSSRDKSRPAISLSKSDSSDSSIEEVAEEPVAGKQTKMNLTTGTDRIWQNGPTPEEVARATTVKEAPPISYDKIGNGAPMMDPHAELSEIRR